MTRVVIDSATWAKLRGPHEWIELCDPSGQTLGYYQPAFRVATIEGGKVQSPYTDAEIEDRRNQSDGRTLAEFWGDLGRP